MFGKTTRKFGKHTYVLLATRTRKADANIDIRAAKRKGFSRTRITKAKDKQLGVTVYFAWFDPKS